MRLELFSKRFKELRENLGLTQSELLKDFNSKYHYNFGKSSISMYENGKRIPEIATLIDFADFFSVSLDYLIGNSDIKNNYEHDNAEYNNSTLPMLLKKAIGNNSISEFSNLTNISEERITELLKGNTDYITNPDMLKRISAITNNVTYDELMTACKYNKIKNIEDPIKQDLKEADDFSYKLLLLLKEEGIIDNIESIPSDRADFIADMIEGYLINTNNHRKYKKK